MSITGTTSTGSHVLVEDCSITDNSATHGGGAIHLAHGSFDSEILSNRSVYDSGSYGGGGAYIYSASGNTLESAGCDWGSGSTDNDPGDIYLRSTDEAFAVPASGDISCTYTDCD